MITPLEGVYVDQWDIFVLVQDQREITNFIWVEAWFSEDASTNICFRSTGICRSGVNGDLGGVTGRVKTACGFKDSTGEWDAGEASANLLTFNSGSSMYKSSEEISVT